MPYCRQCGSEISENASFCSSCGCIIKDDSSSGLGNLRINRQSALLGHDFRSTIFVDGIEKGFVKNGNSVVLQLPQGYHAVSLKTRNYKPADIEVFIREGEETVLQYTVNLTGDDLFISSSSPISIRLNNPSLTDYDQIQATEKSNTRICPKCGGIMAINLVQENKKTGCLTVLWYIFLTITILGLLILIPLMLRNKSKTKTYAVCQKCGFKQLIK